MSKAFLSRPEPILPFSCITPKGCKSIAPWPPQEWLLPTGVSVKISQKLPVM